MTFDLSKLQIPSPDVVPEPTAEEWERLKNQIGFLPWKADSFEARILCGTLRRCRELERSKSSGLAQHLQENLTMADLRDLEADRRMLGDDPLSCEESPWEVWKIALAALDEIARLKRLLVFEHNGKFYARTDEWENTHNPYDTADYAWASVRKAVMK